LFELIARQVSASCWFENPDPDSPLIIRCRSFLNSLFDDEGVFDAAPDAGVSYKRAVDR